MSAPSWAGMSTGESSCTPHLVKEIKRESGSQSDGAYDVDFDTLGQSSRCSQSHSRSLLLGSERYDSSNGGAQGVNSFIPLKITITLHSKLLHSLQKPYSSLKTPSFPTKTPIVATRMPPACTHPPVAPPCCPILTIQTPQSGHWSQNGPLGPPRGRLRF